jgi:hypothetical protein
VNTILRNQVLSILLLPFLIVSCQFNRDKTEISENAISNTIQHQSNEEKEIIDVLEKILIAVGNGNAKELGELTTEKASIAWTYLQESTWMNKEVTVEEYLQKIVENKNLKPIAEIAQGYDISITDGRLATVKAKTIISQFGVPRSREFNHIIMIKEKNDWKLLSIAWTVDLIRDEERKFDLNLFAHTYAQVWSSKRPAFVTMFFTENGSLQVNDGEAAIGRNAISNIAQSFMTKFPDMIVRFDSLVNKPNGIEFHWTLSGTDADPNGKGNQVKVSGFELWTMSEENLIKDSKGNFPSEKYKRQLEFGIDN